MKTIIFVVLIVVIILLACVHSITYAQGPEPLNWMYAAQKCTSLPLTTIQADYQTFVTQYGWNHNLTTDSQWRNAYADGVNEYAHQYGCPDFLNLEGTALTTWQKIYYPTYRRANGHGEQP